MSSLTSPSLNSAAPTAKNMDSTSGIQLPVWVATDPISSKAQFPALSHNIDSTDVIIVGAGITGISVAYECVQKGLKVTMIEAREVLSGETGRTSGHLASALDDRFYELINTFGEELARAAYDSHQYALERVGTISETEGISCEYRQLPGQMIVSVPSSDPSYSQKNDLKSEYDACKKLGIDVTYEEAGRIGKAYEGAVLEYPKQATFHPTLYLNGLLKKLKQNPLFECYTMTRMESYKDHGKGKGVEVKTEGGHILKGNALVMATNVPLQEIEIIGKEGFYRTYCTAHRIPTGVYPDVLLYDNDDPYIYVRKCASPDPKFEYLVVGGEDSKVGVNCSDAHIQARYDRLAKWTKAHFPEAEEVPEFRWSGQIIEPNDHMAYIGLNTGMGIHNVYVATGDSGNGLTHGVIAGRLLTDLIVEANISKKVGLEAGSQEITTKWAKLYSPSRLPKPRTIKEVITENIMQQVPGYGRFLKPEISNIEELPPCSGAIMRAGISQLKKPLAVYKDADGNVRTFSAACPHMKGVVAWNDGEKSWDCPVHGSRFEGATGRCVMGPATHGLKPEDEEAKVAYEEVETKG